MTFSVCSEADQYISDSLTPTKIWPLVFRIEPIRNKSQETYLLSPWLPEQSRKTKGPRAQRCIAVLIKSRAHNKRWFHNVFPKDVLCLDAETRYPFQNQKAWGCHCRSIEGFLVWYHDEPHLGGADNSAKRREKIALICKNLFLEKRMTFGEKSIFLSFFNYALLIYSKTSLMHSSVDIHTELKSFLYLFVF